MGVMRSMGMMGSMGYTERGAARATRCAPIDADILPMNPMLPMTPIGKTHALADCYGTFRYSRRVLSSVGGADPNLV